MKDRSFLQNSKIKALYISIAATFILMGWPLVIFLDKSEIKIMNIPAVYIFVFILWLFICLFTFLGYKMKWGDTDPSKKDDIL